MGPLFEGDRDRPPLAQQGAPGLSARRPFWCLGSPSPSRLVVALWAGASEEGPLRACSTPSRLRLPWRRSSQSRLPLLAHVKLAAVAGARTFGNHGSGLDTAMKMFCAGCRRHEQTQAARNPPPRTPHRHTFICRSNAPSSVPLRAISRVFKTARAWF